MSVSKRWTCASSYGHAFGTLHVCPNNGDVPLSGVQVRLYSYWVGVANLSVERVFYYCECTVVENPEKESMRRNAADDIIFEKHNRAERRDL